MKTAVKSAAACLRDGKISLHPDSRTIKGVWIACEPVLVTSEDDKPWSTAAPDPRKID
jgi:hypothetical protein